MIKDEIKNLIEKAIKDFTKELVSFSVEMPSDKNNGDYSTNVALILSKKLGKNPAEVANEIKEKIGENKLFSKIEVAGPGFVNFFVADKVFIDILKDVDKNYGKTKSFDHSKKIIIDYTDPNPFKEFHIGHLMSNAIGESLSRIFEFQGAKIKRVCYQGDVGLHVASVIAEKLWTQKDDEIGVWVDGLSGTAIAYVGGVKRSKEDSEFTEFVKKVNKKIYDRTDPEVNKLYDSGKELSLKHFDEIYKKLGTKFDWLIFESETGPVGKRIVEKGLKNEIFERGDKGSIIFKGEEYGLHTRVFINSEGLPTYEAKDLGLAEIKYKKYKYDKSVIITGNEVNDYFKVMLCAMDKVLPDLAKKTKHISHGMLRLPEGKMSSRTGKVITGESLIEQVQELVKEKIKDRNLSEQESKEIIESVAIGAIRYSILKQSAGSDIIYDFDKSISFDGDSGPYLQYAYTRAQSVLQKAKDEGVKTSFKKLPSEITQLEKMISYFPEAILRAEQNYEPHFIALYLTELAGIFNNYYSKNKIVDVADELSPYRIALTEAFSVVMKNGLWMLGIKTLKKM
ncbi:MAG: arginine--tRNA ligase [Candidatus Staskawiczbacteria bacterium]|jgi:arginyl-tRNA synthetase